MPGLDHERLDERRKKMDAAILEFGQRLVQTKGGIKETQYWLHQTPAGQDPREAIAQIRSNGHISSGNIAEGPVTELELMQFQDVVR